jgi:hypothetical protein
MIEQDSRLALGLAYIEARLRKSEATNPNRSVRNAE